MYVDSQEGTGSLRQGEGGVPISKASCNLIEFDRATTLAHAFIIVTYQQEGRPLKPIDTLPQSLSSQTKIF